MPTDPSTASTPTTTPAPAPAPDVHFASDGTLVGVDGLLSQIASALAVEAGPILRDVVLPQIRADVALQQRIGAAAGRAAAQEIKPVLWTIAGVLGIVATVYAVSKFRRQPPPDPYVRGLDVPTPDGAAAALPPPRQRQYRDASDW